MKCPEHQDTTMKVVETRPRNNGTYRRYQCSKCGKHTNYYSMEYLNEWKDKTKIDAVDTVFNVIDEKQEVKLSEAEIYDRLHRPWKFKNNKAVK